MGIFDWLTGAGAKTPNTTQQLSKAELPNNSLSVTMSVEIRHLTPDEIETHKQKFDEAFDWVIGEVRINPVDRERLKCFLRDYWNKSRISNKSIDELSVQLSWPSGEQFLQKEAEQRYFNARATIEKMNSRQLIDGLKMSVAKKLLNGACLTTKGLSTKKQVAEFVLGLPAADKQLVLGEARKQLISELPDPKVLSQYSLMQLLHSRMMRAANGFRRHRRHIEVMAMKWPNGRPLYTQVDIDALEFQKTIAPCGLKHGQRLTVEELGSRLPVPLCAAPNCCCMFFPVIRRSRGDR